MAGSTTCQSLPVLGGFGDKSGVLWQINELFWRFSASQLEGATASGLAEQYQSTLFSLSTARRESIGFDNPANGSVVNIKRLDNLFLAVSACSVSLLSSL